MVYRGGRRALIGAEAAAILGCGSGSTEPDSTPPPPTRNLPEQIVVEVLLDSIKMLMPGRGSAGYRPPTALASCASASPA
jgi:hypothetical protein